MGQKRPFAVKLEFEQHLNGEPDALRGASPVREGEQGNRLDYALSLTSLRMRQGFMYLFVIIDL